MSITRRTRDTDEGFGIVEVVVAMFLLALIAIAILPTIIAALRLSSSNITLTTSTQLINQQLDEARELAPTCAALTAYANETIGRLVEDPRGTVLRINRSVTCPTTYPATVRLTAWVTIDGDTARIAESSTLIFVREP